MKVTFKVWNYGLYGDEKTWDIPKSQKRPGRYGECLVDMQSYDEFLKFIKDYEAVGTIIAEKSSEYEACIQLKTTYSTCGEMGYRDTIDFKGIEKLFGKHHL